MSTLAERFAAAVEAMAELPTPSQVIRRILADPVDDGLGASNYEARVRGGSPESHPERMTGREPRPRPVGGRHVDDMREVARSSEAVHEAILTLVDLVDGHSPAADEYTWPDAELDAHLLATTVDPDAARAMQLAYEAQWADVDEKDRPEPPEPPTALDVKLDAEIAWCDLSGELVSVQPLHRAVEAFCDAMKRYRRVADRWPHPAKAGRPPTALLAAWKSGLADEDCCRICLRIEPVGVIRVERMAGRKHGLCRVCYELKLATDGVEPPPELLGIWHDCDRQGRSIVWRTARSRWLESIGVRCA